MVDVSATLPLQGESNDGWCAEFERCLRDPFLGRIYRRDRRLREAIEQLSCYSAHVANNPAGLVVDVCPGAGEWLEWARHYGHEVLGLGVPATEPTGWDKLCGLLWERQNINVVRTRWRAVIRRPDKYLEAGSCSIVRFDGTLSDVYPEFVGRSKEDGFAEPGRFAWNVGPALSRALAEMFGVLHWALMEGGSVLVQLQPSLNQREFGRALRDAAACVPDGFRLVQRHGDLVQRWQKV